MLGWKKENTWGRGKRLAGLRAGVRDSQHGATLGP
jgi:hypothetical protein